MVAAYEKGKPWIGYYWEPTWVMGKLDMTLIEEAPYDEEVWENTKACAYPPSVVNIAVHVDIGEGAGSSGVSEKIHDHYRSEQQF